MSSLPPQEGWWQDRLKTTSGHLPVLITTVATVFVWPLHVRTTDMSVSVTRDTKVSMLSNTGQYQQN